MKTLSALAIALFLACGAWGQTKRAPAKTRRVPNLTWKLFAPAGLGFRIQTPSKPHRIRDLYGDADPRGYKSIDVFGSRESSHIDPAYQIIVLVPSDGMRKESGGRNDLGGLEFTIGGDDAEPASESQILVNGLNGNEFIYHLPDAEMLRHRRARIIDAGKRVFVLIYATKTAAGLNSRAALRFFNSFKVN